MEERQRLADVYREMGDVEIERIANEAYQLTDMAREILRTEVSRRRLDVTLQRAPQETSFEPPDSPYTQSEYLDEELRLVTARTAFSREEAATIEQALEYAGIAHFMGTENVDSVSAVTSLFEDGVAIKVREVDMNRARLALLHMDASGETEHSRTEEDESFASAVRCPRCGSDQPTLQEVVAESSSSPGQPLYCWTCETCGNEWQDDGIVND